MIDRGLGLALKIVDGARRAVPAATIAVLQRIGALDASERERLQAHAQTPVFNVAGVVVGEIRAIEEPLPGHA